MNRLKKINYIGVALLMIIFSSCEEFYYDEVTAPDPSFELFIEEVDEEGVITRVPVETIQTGQTFNIKFLGDADIHVYYLDESFYTDSLQKYNVTQREAVDWSGVSTLFDRTLEEKITTASYSAAGTYNFITIVTNYDYFGETMQATATQQVVVVD